MEKKYARKNKKGIVIAVTAVIILAVSAFLPDKLWKQIFIKTGLQSPEYVSAEMSVHFVDVGQGDCTVITTSDGKSAIIDSGDATSADRVIKYLHSLNISSLDYCIATHFHSDHCGAMSRIIDEFSAEYAVIPAVSEKQDKDDEIYSSFIDSAEKNCKNVVRANQGDSFFLGKVRLDILAPVCEYKDMNNTSLVIKVSCDDASFMITGDCSEQEEKDILNEYSENELKCSVLKAGHHGSKDASCDEWLDTLKPDICVITAGENNSYNLPSGETLKRIEKRNIRYYRTDISSTVVFDYDGEKIVVK